MSRTCWLYALDQRWSRVLEIASLAVIQVCLLLANFFFHDSGTIVSTSEAAGQCGQEVHYSNYVRKILMILDTLKQDPRSSALVHHAEGQMGSPTRNLLFWFNFFVFNS